MGKNRGSPPLFALLYFFRGDAKMRVFIERFSHNSEGVLEFFETLEEFKERIEKENLKFLGRYGLAERFQNGVCEYWAYPFR